MTTAPNRPSAELPDLRIVPTASLVPHEEHDMQRSQPLIERLRVEGILKNPPIVAPLGDGQRYVTLDGTNRAMAMSALNYPHIVVQVVDYDDPALILDTWFHLITGMRSDDLLAAVGAVDGLRSEPSELLHARAELARRRAIATIIVPDSAGSSGGEPAASRVHVAYAEGDEHRRAEILKQVVAAYESQGRINRVSTDHLARLLPYYTDVAALAVFPRYEPSEIMELAQQGTYLPPGLTRHVVPGRALRLNFPLQVLAADQTLEEKDAWLQEWLRAKLAGKEIRYYQESTYLFDE